MLARLATKRAKPAGSYHITHERIPDIAGVTPVTDLHGIGNAVKKKVEEKFKSVIIGELGKQSKAALSQALGKKTGELVWNAARGIDHAQIESDKPRKSVSCDINVSG